MSDEPATKQMRRILDATHALGGKTPGFRRDSNGHWTNVRYSSGTVNGAPILNATPTEIKAAAWELFLIVMKHGDEPIHTPSPDGDLWGWDGTAKLWHCPIESLILAAEKLVEEPQ